MRIENLTLDHCGNRARAAATVTWEDCDRPAQKIYFETEKRFAEGFFPNPEAFLLACIMPGLWHGEARIRVEGSICPDLRDGLATAMSVMRHWYGLTREPVCVEAETRSSAESNIPPRAGFFFSGGADSLATLRLNRLNFPPEHPGYIKDGLIVYGLEVEQLHSFEHVLSALSVIAEDAGITLIPVYTNERTLEDDWDFWLDLFEGSVFASVAHAFRHRLTTVSIASSYDIPNLHSIATHPLLDPNYSSCDLRIKHDSPAFSRLDKIKVLAGWDVALKNLRVCNHAELYEVGRLNCGRCEKCVRTMVELLVVGALERSEAFSTTILSEELAQKAIQLSRKNFRYYAELVTPLEQIGRHDLARCISRKLHRYHRGPGWSGKITGIRRKAAEFDRQRLHGRLRKLKHLTYALPALMGF